MNTLNTLYRLTERELYIYLTSFYLRFQFSKLSKSCLGYLVGRIYEANWRSWTCCMNYLPLISFERIKVNIAACHCSPLKLKWISLAKRAEQKAFQLRFIAACTGASIGVDAGGRGKVGCRVLVFFSCFCIFHYFRELHAPTEPNRRDPTEAVPLVKF